MPKKKRTFVKIIFGLVLAVLIVSLLNVGISLFYERPQFDDFCDNSGIEPGQVIQFDEDCREEFSEARDTYTRNLFWIYSIIGFVSLIAGVFVANLTLQIALMASGFVNVVTGIVRNFSDKTIVFITILILVILAVIFTIIKLRDD